MVKFMVWKKVNTLSRGPLRRILVSNLWWIQLIITQSPIPSNFPVTIINDHYILLINIGHEFSLTKLINTDRCWSGRFFGKAPWIQFYEIYNSESKSISIRTLLHQSGRFCLKTTIKPSTEINIDQYWSISIRTLLHQSLIFGF